MNSSLPPEDAPPIWITMLIVVVLIAAIGGAMASCLHGQAQAAEPPMPRKLERESTKPLRLADTGVGRCEYLADDLVYRLEHQCEREGGALWTGIATATCGAHPDSPPTFRGWLYTAGDVPNDRRGMP